MPINPPRLNLPDLNFTNIPIIKQGYKHFKRIIIRILIIQGNKADNENIKSRLHKLRKQEHQLIVIQ